MSDAIRIIKKYANRRLYDTETSSYIVLHDIKDLVMAHQRFQIVDAKTDEDLTRSVLLQIILEEEVIGHSGAIFTAPVLEQIIRFYGHSMQGLMGVYLERNLQTLSDIQNKMNESTSNQAGLISPEAMLDFMNLQMPMLQGVMNNYVEQSKNMFFNMQNQMQNMFATPSTAPDMAASNSSIKAK